jgi:hypothetical protein
VFLAAVGLPLACPTATLADFVSAPDSARIAVLRLALVTFDDIRIVTDSTKVFTHDAVVSSDGLRLRGGPSGRRIVSWPLPEEHLVPWPEIESIHVRRGAGGFGPLAGGAVGFTIGSAISFAHTPFPGTPSGKPVLLGLVVGVALGTLLDRPGPWHAVYP